ncbi:MAG: hypothetical protein KatS3mg105_1306 [Gemmatales bacterium]|nr:MAG: hypothetical protein KatS3mg105_1306 [Gemmatales bacterium]
MKTPKWLADREGDLRRHPDGQSYVVYFLGEPQFLLRPIPVRGKYSCEIEKMVNGVRLDQGETYRSVEDALQGGLEIVRKTLGW